MLLFVTSFLFAQVVTPVVPSTDIFGWVLGLIPIQYQAIVFTVITALWFFEQFLASTNLIKANSTLQLITGWITRLYALISKPKV